MVKGLVHFSFTVAGKWERGYLIHTAKTQSTELAMLAHTWTVQGRRDNKKGWNVFLHMVNIISCTLCMYMYMSCILRVHINTAYYKGLVACSHPGLLHIFSQCKEEGGPRLSNDLFTT